MAPNRSVAPRENTSAGGPTSSPRACSGAMNSGVPTTAPVAVSPPVASRIVATPKSVRNGRPASSNSTLAGLMSRWTIPWRWASARAPNRASARTWIWPGREGSVMGHLLAQGAPGQVGQDEDDVVAVVDDVEEGHDVRVAEARESGGFSSDPVAGTVHLVGAAVQQQTLAGHQLSVSIDREVDDAHPTAPEPALHLVLHGPVSLRAGRTAADPGVPGEDLPEMTSLKRTCHTDAPTMRRTGKRPIGPVGTIGVPPGRCAPDVCERPTTGPRQETP